MTPRSGLKTGVTQWVSRSGQALAAISLLSMTVIGTVDLVSTNFLNRPIPGAFELIETLMVVTVFMALASAQARRQHIVVDIAINHLAASTQRLCRIVGDALGAVFFFVIAWQGWLMALRSWAIDEAASGLIGFPIYPAKIALAVGASLITLQCLWDLVVGIAALKRKSKGHPRNGAHG